MANSSFPDRPRARFRGTLAAGLGAFLGALTVASAAPAADITSTELRDGLWLFEGAGSNVLALADGDAALVVDGGLEANAGDLFAAISEATGAARIGTLIVTHWHPEQVGLNARAAADGATIVAHEQTRIYLSHRVTSTLVEGPFGPLPDASQPTETTRLGGEFTVAGHEVAYSYLPAAHTNGDLYVWFPDLNVLAAGGAVGSDSWPLIDYRNGGIIGGLVQAHETLGEIVNAETIVVPAQGPAITGADLLRHRDMYRQLFRDVSYLMNEGMGYNDVVFLNPLKGHEEEFGDPSVFLDGAYRSKEMAEVPN
jgi:glyoxylase-like metal-dependent hydrolase (beta-lactamase superfamily II)